MSLASLNMAGAANRGSIMTVRHPVDRTPLMFGEGDNKRPITITLLGKDSDEWIKAGRRARQAQRDAAMNRTPWTAADDDAQANEALAAATVTWEGIPAAWLTPNGTDETPVECTPANAAKLYANAGVNWLREQVDQHIGERGNLLKASQIA